MNKMKKLILMLSFLLLLFNTSCSSIIEDMKISNENRIDISRNPFEDNNDDISKLTFEYGHSPDISSDYIIKYTGDVLEIPYKFYGGRVDSEVGLLIFIDGVIQSYLVKENNTYNSHMNTFKIPKKSNNSYLIELNPNIGIKGEELILNFMCISCPIYDQENEMKIHSQRLANIQPRLIKILKNNYLNKIYTDTEKSSKINYRKEKNETNDNALIFDLRDKNENINIISKNDIANLKFEVCGADIGKYRSTLFINNEPVKIFEEEFLEYEIVKDEKLTVEFEYDTNNLIGKNTIYVISINIDNNKGMNSRNSFKTETKLLVIE